jgi:hypothetical protein
MNKSPIGTLIVLALAICPTFAKNDVPTAEEFARATRSIKLNASLSKTDEREGGKVTVTGTDLSNLKSVRELEKGQVIAVVQATGIKDLPNGKYNVYVAKRDRRWQAFFLSRGKLFEECGVTVTEGAAAGQKVRPIEIKFPKPCGFCAGGICTPQGACFNLCRRCE